MSEPTSHEHAGREAHADAPVQDRTLWTEPVHVDRYESLWIRLSVAVLIVFAIAVLVSSTVFGIQVPDAYARIDPNTLLTDPNGPFANPGVRELAPGKYEAYIRAQIWAFLPGEIRIPAGSTITFYATSQDVQHGMIVEGTNINMMILPGQISTLTATFDEPGEHNMICHEYCGIGHHNMFAKIIVE